ncbi:voltage-dependent calcium channel subunit straightjacket isoform X3 [Rhodnius prolixus]|uniref:voltage-dependent calcium channel subunit straightjacket isoform X3 n=1 Tax=Rhodnius prolixus TaxID=13249 RepID=UPI003D18A60F
MMFIAKYSIIVIFIISRNLHAHGNLPKETLDSWVSKLGAELWNFGDVVTRKKEMQDSFKDAKVEPREGLKLVQDIAREIKNMMELKVSAVRRIMDTAENAAMASQDEGNVPLDYQYYNAKTMEVTVKGVDPPNSSRLLLTPNSNFFNIAINTNVSAVHVPTNVYDRAPDVLHGIEWSSNLNEIFISNFREDDSLSWQYFGSSTGFMRQFPAMKWEQTPSGPVDLYDCRTRSWYIEAATSPKDILILVDNSGSMMGQRKEIARHVVNNILDTLGNNDFVNILTFVKDTVEVVPCFKDKLVQANLANIRELKMGMERMEMASNIANFSVALTKAFELLQEYRERELGAACNQAIMLVTDGVPYNFKEIFEKYNWRNLPTMPVRVFTYLIGREVADVREVKWMACANQGYYVHLSTMAEVREQVLQYIPVMARPMVLRKSKHPVIWTPVYADVTDPKMTDWLWEMKERAKQKERSIIYRRKGANQRQPRDEEEEHRLALQDQWAQNQNDNLYPYKMMTSVSMPVYDRRENANLTERVLVNEAYWVLETTETKIANLLGVAGTDVPNSDIQRRMVQHLLGVNAYAFIVTNNGYILIHPDLRPVFQGILKPSYNNIDVTDVEILDDDNGPREYNQALLILREKLINQVNGSDTMAVKYHYDGLRRVSKGRRRYYYNVIGGTPFELVVALPDPYGLNRVEAQLEIKRIHAKGKKVYDLFRGKNWKIHPEWFYCKYHYWYEHQFKSPEEELIHFLKRSALPGWKWPLQRTSSPPEHQSDRTLLLSLVYDAKATEWFSENLTSTSAEEKGPIAKLIALLSRHDMKQRFGLTLVFMATRSGLTRWQDISMEAEEENGESTHFSEMHNRATDEIWYRRAVEQYLIEPESFVYSVPFDAGDKNDTLVTATHAIFHTEGSRQAPAAVVGFQFHHTALHSRFMNITSQCDKCEKTCAHNDLDCYIIDNHGYIVVSENRKHTGVFFGEIEGSVMESMVIDRVFQRVIMYDYQAVCFKSERQEASHSNKNILNLQFINWFMNWIGTQIIWVLLQFPFTWLTEGHSFTSDGNIYTDTYDESAEANNMEQNMKPSDKVFVMMINRTRPQPCDMEIPLYLLQPYNRHVRRDIIDHCEKPYIVHSVPNSNLVMVVVNRLCKFPNIRLSVLPYAIQYNDSLSCHKVMFNKLYRRGPKECTNSHPKEKDIKLCGRGSQLPVWSPLMLFINFLLIYTCGNRLIVISMC